MVNSLVDPHVIFSICINNFRGRGKYKCNPIRKWQVYKHENKGETFIWWNPPFSMLKSEWTWKTWLAGMSSKVLLNCTWQSMRVSGRSTVVMARAWLGVQDPNKQKRGKQLCHKDFKKRPVYRGNMVWTPPPKQGSVPLDLLWLPASSATNKVGVECRPLPLPARGWR